MTYEGLLLDTKFKNTLKIFRLTL